MKCWLFMKWGDNNHSDPGLYTVPPLVSLLSCCYKKIHRLVIKKSSPITEGKPLYRFAGIIHFVENLGHLNVLVNKHRRQ